MKVCGRSVAFAFASALRAAVKNSDSSEIVIAERAGLPVRTLQQLQNASMDVSLAQVFRLADALEVPWSDLLTEVRARLIGLADKRIPARLRGALEGDSDTPLREAAAAPQNAPRQRSVHDAPVNDLVAIVRTLPTDTRQVLTLRKVYGLTYSDIAARLAMSVADVERHLVTAVLACDRALEAPRGFRDRLRGR